MSVWIERAIGIYDLIIQQAEVDEDVLKSWESISENRPGRHDYGRIGKKGNINVSQMVLTSNGVCRKLILFLLLLDKEGIHKHS